MKKLDKLRELEALRQPCQIYSRVCGYFAPLKDWNAGKQSEFKDRKTFKKEV